MNTDISINYEERTIKIYKGYTIKDVRNHEEHYYLVYDEYGLQRGGCLSTIEICKRWINILIEDKKNKKEN